TLVDGILTLYKPFYPLVHLPLFFIHHMLCRQHTGQACQDHLMLPKALLVCVVGHVILLAPLCRSHVIIPLDMHAPIILFSLLWGRPRQVGPAQRWTAVYHVRHMVVPRNHTGVVPRVFKRSECPYGVRLCIPCWGRLMPAFGCPEARCSSTQRKNAGT